VVFDRWVRIEIWSDVVCPWCYIGKRNLDAALDGFDHRDDTEVVFRSFQLDPSAPAQPTPAVDYLSQRYGGGREQALSMMRQVTTVAAQAGLDYHLEDSLTGQTLDAHRILHLASEFDAQPAMVERIFAGHFSEKRSVFDHESLVELGVEAGVPADRVREVLAGSQYHDAVAQDIAQAQVYGITAVPFFVFDQTYGVSGAQPPEVMAGVLNKAWDG
jgi:predicted DsbA family dithiol-disulfide isomerase